MDTFFAPAHRTERRKFKNQLSSIAESSIMNALLETASGVLVVLNEDRQIVALNHHFLEQLGIEDAEQALGLRLGESLSCVHAGKGPAGCGTTEYCLTCGAAIAMMAAIDQNQSDERICALVSDQNGEISDICLQIKARPIKADGQRWILIYARDITKEQFWANLDHVFFHDINNTLTSLYGHLQIADMDHPDDGSIQAIKGAVERLISEVAVQKRFSLHKDQSYTPAPKVVPLSDIRQALGVAIKGHKALKNKKILENWTDPAICLKTDLLLLSRILGNMVINALEATIDGGSIRISVEPSVDAVTFEVWNQTAIPEHFQKRIFQRHFTSKPGPGRGFGTYSMKLFGETCLNSRVWFETSEVLGTCFKIRHPI